MTEIPMIEKVAKVIGEHFYAHVDHVETPETWASSIACARAAIEAMRPATEAMLNGLSGEVWNAMIDRALQEERT